MKKDMIFKTKKGISDILLIFEVIVTISLVVLFMTIAKKIATAGAINEEFIAKDSALMTDALHALPGEVFVSYDVGNSTNSFTVYLFNGDSKVTGLKGLVHSYPYREGEYFELEENKLEIKKGEINIFSFEKNGNTIFVKKQGESENE